jgi:hypothetical protein
VIRSTELLVACVAAALVMGACGSQAPSIDPGTFGTWLWNGTTWIQVAHAEEAPPIDAYGLPGGESLFFWKDHGGLVESDGTRWDGSSWVSNVGAVPEPPTGTNLPNDAGDSSLQRTALVLDEVNAQLLYIDPNSKTMSTWSKDSWKVVVSPSEWPKARFIYGVTYDFAGARVVMVLCCDPYEDGMETWQWKGGKLTELALLSQTQMSGFKLAPDGLGHVIAFGNEEGFVLDGGRWVAQGVRGAMPASRPREIVYNRADGKMTAIGSDLRISVWHPDSGRWDVASSGVVPPDACAVSNAVYDPDLAGIVLTTLAGQCMSFGLL